MFGKGSRKLETIVGEGTRIAGEMAVQGTLRIDGIVEGDIQADWVVVGESGKIRGNARTRGMVVGGAVEGNIEATEMVELREKARMAGEIHAPKLSVSEGALFDGQTRMQDNGAEADAQEGNVRPLIPSRTAT
jgi:cytoskeletal protein CcmA (bactofilin family)